jgi:hypothetical protein
MNPKIPAIPNVDLNCPRDSNHTYNASSGHCGFAISENRVRWVCLHGGSETRSHEPVVHMNSTELDLCGICRQGKRDKQRKLDGTGDSVLVH